MFIVNKLNFLYFTCFVYTFLNYKYNALLKRDDVCLIPLSTLVTLSLFDEGKEIRIVCVKWPRNPMLNVVTTLWQRRKPTSKLSFSTVSQRWCASWDGTLGMLNKFLLPEKKQIYTVECTDTSFLQKKNTLYKSFS